MENIAWLEEEILRIDRLYDDGEFLDCKRSLLDVLEQEPGYGRAHYLLGCVYFQKLSDYDKALEHLRLAVKFAPRYPDAYYTFSYLLNVMKRHEELQHLVKQAESIDCVNSIILHCELGKSFEKQQRYDEAIVQFETAWQLATLSHESETVQQHLKRIAAKRRKSQFKRIRVFFK